MLEVEQRTRIAWKGLMQLCAAVFAWVGFRPRSLACGRRAARFLRHAAGLRTGQVTPRRRVLTGIAAGIAALPVIGGIPGRRSRSEPVEVRLLEVMYMCIHFRFLPTLMVGPVGKELS